jgi:hypothetical protein
MLVVLSEGIAAFLLASLPSVAPALTASSCYLPVCLSSTKKLVAASPQVSAEGPAKDPQTALKTQRQGGSDRAAITVLQFLVGGLVVFGGSSFAYFAVNSFGTALGSVHLSIGFVGLIAGFLILRGDISRLRGLLVAINLVTIGYSSFSEYIVQTESLLPGFASIGSLVGTIVAITMSCALLALLFSRSRRPIRE